MAMSVKHPGENTLAAFVEGRLPVAETAALDEHLDACETCRALVVAAARASLDGEGDAGGAVAPPSAPPERDVRFGRYTLLDVLGRGGMGVVYAAHDSALDRKVALKVLRGDLAARIGLDLASARLLREARIAARLSHPNVVTIYDVGSHDGHVFIAMEYVDGQPLSAWLDAGPHPASAILERFVQAGRGLAAAHAAGLVHRDFKPSNVMVGTDGRVRVTDFGLAGWTGEETSGGGSHSEPASDKETRTAGVLGTPLYMAPEQHRGERAGPLADQFSFAVALHEALYGRGAHEGRTLDELAVSKERGPAEPPLGGEVPERVRSALLRALRPRPEARFTSMDALLTALAPETASPWRRMLAVAGGLLLLALGSLGAYLLGAGPSQVCAGGEQKLAGVWDDARRQAMLSAFHATGVPYAEDAARASAALLDAYTREWVVARRDACEATQVRKEQLEAHQALRMMCLDERLEAVRALGTFFTRADRDVVEHAVEAARALPPLSHCADLRALTARVPPPTDPAVRAKVEALGVKEAEAQALMRNGKYREGLDVVRVALEEARATGYQPLEARLAALKGEAETQVGDAPAAEKTLREAVLAAEAGRDDVTAARAWTSLVFIVGRREQRFDEALTLGQHAQAAIVRLGNAELDMARLLATRGSVLWAKGDYAASLKDAEESLAIRQRLLPEDHPDLALSLSQLATTYGSLSRFDEARESQRKALAIQEKAFGPHHPTVAMTLFNLGLLLHTTDRQDEGEACYRRALDILDGAGLGEHPLIPRLLAMMGTLASGRGDHARAVQLAERGRDLAVKLQGPEHPSVALSLVALGRLLSRAGRNAEAFAALERARAIFEKALGPEHPNVAMVLSSLGKAQLRDKQYAAARATIERAIAVRTKALGPDTDMVGEDLDNLGVVLLRQGRPAEALALHRKALSLFEKRTGQDSYDAAVVLSNLIEALVVLRRYAEALPLAERALAIREKLGPEGGSLTVALSDLGMVAVHLGRFDLALPALERAVKQPETDDNRESLTRARRYLERARAERKGASRPP
ncbi:tetratricopeptide repeat protein [Pyxidicoccus parkwayensis]|uniref:Tetratricopeptide repeat protein n=1 Tax=Pyxidicoccus parkwayensis TaxID=2813578 RepID=A0ABX7NNI3_9BACT|nr:serine/threonine-protein kinase [Pyxidicoccus parkwaysis]QSQ18961.1 tetratricopeptide repeat protein [Pyxidicoccus parkwaysis]